MAADVARARERLSRQRAAQAARRRRPRRARRGRTRASGRAAQHARRAQPRPVRALARCGRGVAGPSGQPPVPGGPAAAARAVAPQRAAPLHYGRRLARGRARRRPRSRRPDPPVPARVRPGHRGRHPGVVGTHQAAGGRRGAAPVAAYVQPRGRRRAVRRPRGGVARSRRAGAAQAVGAVRQRDPGSRRPRSDHRRRAPRDAVFRPADAGVPGRRVLRRHLAAERRCAGARSDQPPATDRPCGPGRRGRAAARVPAAGRLRARLSGSSRCDATRRSAQLVGGGRDEPLGHRFTDPADRQKPSGRRGWPPGPARSRHRRSRPRATSPGTPRCPIPAA